MAEKSPVEEQSEAVGSIFINMIATISAKAKSLNHNNAVDVEINFQSVTIDKNGIPLFTKHTKESQIQLKLATRILPPP
jgi:hypothetical protein